MFIFSFWLFGEIQEQGNLSTCLDMSIWIVRAKTRLVCFNRNLETKILESSKVLEKHWSWENMSIKKESRNWTSLQPSKCIWDPQPNLSGFQQNSAELGPKHLSLKTWLCPGFFRLFQYTVYSIFPTSRWHHAGPYFRKLMLRAEDFRT